MFLYSPRVKFREAWQKLPLNEIVQKLIWNPEQCFFGALDDHAALLSASSNGALFNIDQPHLVDADGALVMTGLPSLNDFSCEADCDIAGALRSILATHDPCDVHRRLGSTWSIADYRNQTLTAFSDFSGYNAIFYAETDDVIALSNKAGLLRPFAKKHNLFGPGDINARALSWVPATTIDSRP